MQVVLPVIVLKLLDDWLLLLRPFRFASSIVLLSFGLFLVEAIFQLEVELEPKYLNVVVL